MGKHCITELLAQSGRYAYAIPSRADPQSVWVCVRRANDVAACMHADHAPALRHDAMHMHLCNAAAMHAS